MGRDGPADHDAKALLVVAGYALNGEVLQEGTTAQMIHTVTELVSYGSNLLTLQPGDVIATGTPPGSGSARVPPIFLEPGDISVCNLRRRRYAEESGRGFREPVAL